MNEITKIHLGRTAFTIAIDAHKALRQYLDAIKKHVGSKHKEVLDEVELRMAELLTERGITASKVVVAKDVEFLKEQLGDPSDFQDEDDQPASEEGDTSRRLLRDPRDQILGGVASGLGTYFGIDPWIIRLLFIGLTFAGGSSILAYLVLWAVVPKAQSNSDYLRMKGKPVTVEAIKDYVANQELDKDARQAGNHLGQALSEIFQTILKIARLGLGTLITTVSVVSIVWVIVIGAFVLVSPERLSSAGRIFPVGQGETALVFLALAVLLSALTLLLGSGIAFLRKKWPLPVWASAALATIFVVGSAVGGAFGTKFAPRIQERYDAAHKTETRQLGDFHQLNITGDEAIVYYEYADTPSVDVRSVGDGNKDGITTEVKDGKLFVNANDVTSKGCDWFCIDARDVSITVRAPKLDDVTVRKSAVFRSEKELHQDKLTITSQEANHIFISHMRAKQTAVSKSTQTTLELTGITSGLAQDRITMGDDQTFTISASDEVLLTTDRTCDRYDSDIYLWQMPSKLTINSQLFTNLDQLQGQQHDDEQSTTNCVTTN